ncbi:MAG: hypothetical protein IKN65_00075 [Clostridia bacterium]|nr:hypothetical protein [Bacilli bacterium]MBR3672679.1 hypothetical protein [Clostridia bacterium]MBR4671606.1 hypothetical protein [Bacilli bacterium]
MEQKVKELELKIQELEERLTKLENGEFATGIYLDGCSEADVEYITGKKAGEQ